MNSVLIYHNPRCSKSREALAYLKNKGVSLTVRDYLKEPLTRDEIVRLFEKLGDDVAHVLRKGKAVYKEKYTVEPKGEHLIDALVKDPILMERPIIEVGEKAVIARPTERISEIL